MLYPAAFSPLTPRPQGRPVCETKGTIDYLAVSPDSTRIAVSTSLNELFLYTINNRTIVNIKHDNIVTSLVFSVDSAHLITGDTDGRLLTWDVVSGEPVGTIFENNSGILSIASTSTFIAVGVKDRILLFDARYEPMGEIELLGANRLLAFSPDGLDA